MICHGRLILLIATICVLRLSRSSWDPLLYVLAEMQLQGRPLPPATRMMLIRACREQPARYVVSPLIS